MACRVFGHSKRDDHSATMCYMIAETRDCPFCKAIMRHTRTRHAPTLPRDEITRADPRRATHTIADPLTAPPARAHTTQCVQSRAPREHRLQLPLPIRRSTASPAKSEARVSKTRRVPKRARAIRRLVKLRETFGPDAAAERERLLRACGRARRRTEGARTRCTRRCALRARIPTTRRCSISSRICSIAGSAGRTCTRWAKR